MTLIEARENKGLTQKELADKIDFNRRKLCNFETGWRYPNENNKKIIQDALGVNEIEFGVSSKIDYLES